MEPTLAQQLETLKADFTVLQGKLTKSEANLTAKGEELTAAQAAVVTANEAKTKAEADLATAKATIGEQATKITALEGNVTKLTGEVEKTKKVLAMHPDVKALFHDGEEAGKHSAGTEAGAGKSLLLTYNELRKNSPRAASKFWRENEKAIQEEQKAQAKA